MREAVIVASSRTPLAKSYRGSFNMTRPDDLAAHAIRHALGKVPSVDLAEVEEVVLGCGQPHGAAGHNIARVAALRAGLPVTTAAVTVNRFCNSGLQAVVQAAHLVINEHVDVAIGGGVESITMMVRDSSPNPWVQEHAPGVYMAMGDTAEVVAKRYNVTREAQDEFALVSQQRTARAQQDGFFRDELAPTKVTRAILDKKSGEKVGEEEVCVERDECNRPDTTLEGLLKLPPPSTRRAAPAASPPATRRSSPTAPRRRSSCLPRVRAPSASSRCSCSAATRSPAANPTRWESVQCSPFRNCSNGRASAWTTWTSGS